MDFQQQIWWCFLLIVSGVMTSHGVAQGPGWCWNTISSWITIRETFIESATKRTATCCDWFCTSRCSSYRVVYYTAYRDAMRLIYKLDLGCCPGWKPMEGHCVPATIPDGPAAATLVPFEPGGPGSSGTKSARDSPGTSGAENPAGRAGSHGQGRSSANKGVIFGENPRLPHLGSPHEGGVSVMKKSRADVWAAAHPAEMAGIVTLLAVVVIVGFVGWTLYKRRLQREYPRMVRITKDDISTYESSFQYEIIPTVSGKTTSGSAPSTSEIAEEAEEQYQNIVPSESFAQAQSASLQRDSVYEIDTLETQANPRYTLLNVGNRDVVSVYTPLQIGNVRLTPSDDR